MRTKKPVSYDMEDLVEDEVEGELKPATIAVTALAVAAVAGAVYLIASKRDIRDVGRQIKNAWDSIKDDVREKAGEKYSKLRRFSGDE